MDRIELNSTGQTGRSLRPTENTFQTARLAWRRLFFDWLDPCECRVTLYMGSTGSMHRTLKTGDVVM